MQVTRAIEQPAQTSAPKPYVPTTGRQRSLIVFGLISLIAASFAYAPWRLRLSRILQKKLEAVSRAGYPTNAQQLDRWYATVPSDENVALRFLKTASKISEPGTNYEKEFRAWLSQTESPASIPSELNDWASRNAPLVAELQSVVGRNSRYPVDLSRGDQAEFPHLNKVRNAALLAAVYGTQSLRQNDLQAAAASVLLMLRLADSLAGEPAFLSQGTRWRIETDACSCLERVLNQGKVSAATCEQLSASLSRAEETNGITRAWLGERACVVELIDMVYPLGRSGKLEPFRGFFFFTGHRERDFTLCLDGIEARLRIASLCRPQSSQMAKDQDAYEQKAFRRNFAFVSMMMLRTVGALEQSTVRRLATLRVLQTALAIERYRASNARLPPNLAVLAPQFIKDVPTDPCDGRPLRFRPQSKGYVVYSVGLNGIDDGGVEEVSGKMTGTLGRADITFRVSR